MTALRAERIAKLARRPTRFADDILRDGLPFRELTEDQAAQDWSRHIQNMPENGRKGGRVHGCAHIRKQRRTRQEGLHDLVVA